MNEERRRRHRELKNEGVRQREFDIGDLVIVRRQVQSRAVAGVSAKLTFKAKGPYRVIEKLNPGSYSIQKLPFLEGLGQPGRILKESAARMEKIPSTLVLHKRTDGVDTRLASIRSPLAPSPLERWLGVLDCGAYRQAEGNPNWAFVKLDSMWSDEVVASDSSDDEEQDDNDNDDEMMNLDDGSGKPAGASRHQRPPRPPPQVQDHPETSPTRTRRTIPALADAANPIQQRLPSSRILQRQDKKAMRRLYRSIEDSTDKLFFIRRKRGLYGPRDCYNWSLVQVDLNETDPVAARDFAIYRVKWYDVNEQDSKTKPVVECRFWPKLQEFDDDGSFVRYLQMKPNKVSNYLSHIAESDWCQADVALGEDRLVGPLISRPPATLVGPTTKLSRSPIALTIATGKNWNELLADVMWMCLTSEQSLRTSKRTTITGDTTVQNYVRNENNMKKKKTLAHPLDTNNDDDLLTTLTTTIYS